MKPARLPIIILLFCFVIPSGAQEISDDFLSVYRSYEEAYANNDFARATELAREALELAKVELGPGHEKTAVMMINLGHLLVYAGDPDEGAEYLMEAESILRKLHGDDHELLITIYEDMGAYYAGNKALLHAREQFLNALRIREKTYGADDPGNVQVLSSLAQVDAADNRLDSASKYYRSAIDIIKNHFADDDPRVAALKISLADVSFLQNKLDEAEQLYLEALRSFETHLPEDDTRIINAHARLGEVYLRRGDHRFTEHADRIISLARTEDGAAKPLFIAQPEPVPGSAATRQGSVLLEFTITADGKVKNAQVIESSPADVFEQAALDAASLWRFLPRTDDGVKVAQPNTRARIVIDGEKIDVHLGEMK